MYFNAKSKRWTLESLVNPEKFIETESDFSNQIPIGTHNWKTGSANSLCGSFKGTVTELSFSQCYPNKYTCNSGHCVPLHQKCNTEINCEDKSDEYNCQYIKLGSNYNKGILPIDVEAAGEPLTVYINVSILAFPDIDTMNLKFTADFYLNMRWYDLRLEYQDLNNLTFLNAISDEDKRSLWVPKLAFLNALGPYTTVVDDVNSGVIVREGSRLNEKINLATEGK